MIHLRGRTALVTGSTQGVGRAIAEAFAQAGADVVVHGRDASEDWQSVVESCQSHGVQAEFIALDLLAAPVEEIAPKLFELALDKLPAIDTLVNNAGTFRDKPFLEMDLATYRHTMQLNVDTPYFLTQCFARHWVERKVAGRVLMTGSINGQLAEPDHTCYDSSKGAVATMIKSLCVSLAPHGIRVNGMAPGLVSTPLTSIIEEDPDFKRWMCYHTPNGEVPGPEVCGDAAVFLVSDAARHVHGQMLLVDGGMSIWQQPDMPAEWSKK